MDEQVEYGIVVSFPDQSASFVNGFEAGGVWEQMRNGSVAEIDATTHYENRDVIARMAVAEGWDVDVRATSVAGWDQTKLRKTTKAPERSNPHGLRVVPSS